MAEDGGGGGEKTQAPTAHKLQKAREEGNIAQSRELLLLVSLGAFLLMFIMTMADSAEQFLVSMKDLMSRFWFVEGDTQVIYALTQQAVSNGLVVSMPFMIFGSAAIIICGIMQTGFLFRPQALEIDIKRLSPMKGMKRVISLNNIIELLKNIIKISVFSFVLYGVAYKTLDISPMTERWTEQQLLKEMADWFVYAVFLVIIVQAGITLLDEVWTRYRYFSKLKMSLQDIKDETKQTEGDPLIKSRLRQIRLRRARMQIKKAVQKATVVIVNPTHYAVALYYDTQKGAAPQLVAKGVDELAFRMREMAGEAKVPIVSNPPLARSLYVLPLETEIPEEFWKPVAAIIAYVIKLKTPGARTGIY
ncbi:EscU/YscU/HrcU family type III secretion system export apparatus switch protein [Acetobacteraceae bacterium ESL0709]|nr:EscU/YscU/HrcU family type III secretion system export apparatus switch protein [Acetobacteraceae bacterium ESL0697]MDF7679032.1 EscU/YscU/HrcU family type III secretion system export apparatus switch protein [Acetobacteraceae bacterium ESL0709]